MDEPPRKPRDRTRTGELRELVAKHRVCWQVWPLQVVDSDEIRSIGYELNLQGTHHEPSHTPHPGCDECVEVHSALRAIADWIMPQQDRDSVYHVRPFDHALRFSERRGFRKDVELVITIKHRSTQNAPIDECEIRCLREMESRLAELGARSPAW